MEGILAGTEALAHSWQSFVALRVMMLNPVDMRVSAATMQ